MENTRTGKLSFKDKVGGIFSAIYMNNVSSEFDNEYNNFYISAYIKNKNEYLNITLDGKKPLEIKELSKDNEFSHLLYIKSDWGKNYIMSFENNERSEVNLLIENGQFSSGQLSFSKDLR